jgi:hypothetical protein
MVLRSKDEAKPQLQYLALQHEQVIMADPPVNCLMHEDPDMDVKKDSDGGDESNLALDDVMVKDCKKLFERTAMENCGKKMTLNVLSATLQIIDGFEVNVDAKVVGPGGTRHHSPKCLFETSTDHTDASLLQHGDPTETDPTEGLVGTVTMLTDLCDADKEDGPGAASFEQHVAFGELSRYKGYEHVNDELPRIHVQLEDGAPSELDFRKQYPKCYSGERKGGGQKSGSVWKLLGVRSGISSHEQLMSFQWGR